MDVIDFVNFFSKGPFPYQIFVHNVHHVHYVHTAQSLVLTSLSHGTHPAALQALHRTLQLCGTEQGNIDLQGELALAQGVLLCGSDKSMEQRMHLLHS